MAKSWILKMLNLFKCKMAKCFNFWSDRIIIGTSLYDLCQEKTRFLPMHIGNQKRRSAVQ